MARRRTGAAIATAAALALTMAGCGSDEADGTPTAGTSSSSNSSSSPASGSGSGSSSSSPEWDKDHALALAKKALHARDKHETGAPLTEDDDFATRQYVRAYNQELQKIKDQQVTPKGSVKTTSVHLKELNPDAIGGPDLTVFACSTSTVRYYGPQGKDVSAHPETGEPLSKGPRKNAHLVSLTTTDKGETWQITGAQQLLGKKAKKTPCDVSK